MSCKNNGCQCDGEKRFDESKLSEILDAHPNAEGELITILQETQAAYGYLPKEAIEYMEEKTGLKAAKIYGVATFYSQFRMEPIGKNLIMLCKGTACHVNGADAIEEAITEALSIKDGETTEDNLFTLNNVACLGCCSLAPVMMIKTAEGEETFGNLTKTKTKEILEKIREDELSGRR